MFTHKDIKYRSIFVVNCVEQRTLRVVGGELMLEDVKSQKTLTKLPFQKILALFIIGHITITTPLIDKCTKFGVPLVVMKPNLRPVFFFSITAEANFLLRKRQYEYERENLLIPKILVSNKIKNQIRLLEKTRLKSDNYQNAKLLCKNLLDTLSAADMYDKVMGIEGKAATIFFSTYFSGLNWVSRCPRVKSDPINATLDIGYTILFNYIEVFVRLFGFDPFRGVYHQLWFRRKSLICDLMEPFRALVDSQVRKAFNSGQCKPSDFEIKQNMYLLKREKNGDYTRMFYDVLIEHKSATFKYIQQYYRCFMQQKSADDYPEFLL